MPFAAATNFDATPHVWAFLDSSFWTDGQQIAVSIRTNEVQNRYGQVFLKAGRSTGVDHSTGNIRYGKPILRTQ